MLADWTQVDFDHLTDNIVKIITLLLALVSAIGVLLSKLRGDKIQALATTAVQQNEVLAAKADAQVAIAQDIHEKVNGNLTAALQTTAEALEKVALVTGTTEDQIKAGVARVTATRNEAGN